MNGIFIFLLSIASHMLHKRWFRVILVILVAASLFQYCVQRKLPEFNDPRGKAYAGSETCVGCHANVVAAYAANAHGASTQPVTAASMLGSFSPDSNRFQYTPTVSVRMEAREGKFFQTAYSHDTMKASFPFDLVIGSGRKAQTFLYWNEKNAYQLPVSYSVVGKCWVNSPNYPSDRVRFDRVIPVGCFECHASYIERTGAREEKGYRVDEFDATKIIYGIDCERCHGPAAAHVAYQQDHPAEKVAKYIGSFKQLSNIQRMEACATCHSGLHEPIRSPFYFRPGNSLKDFYHPDTTNVSPSKLDVHGNQYQLLMESKCFKGAIQTMSCNSCHDPHSMERNNMKVFSTRCMSCHQQNTPSFCSFEPKVGATIVNNCIDCHMPATPSRLISLQAEGKADHIQNLVRSHLIGIYPDATRKQLRSIRDMK
jgi:hypothetical protein